MHSADTICYFSAPSIPLKALVDISDSVIFLSWKPPHDDGGAPITHYEIYRFSYLKHQMIHMKTLGTEYHYQILNVKDKTKRIYGIQARNIIGTGPIATVTAKVSTCKYFKLILYIIIFIGI